MVKKGFEFLNVQQDVSDVSDVNVRLFDLSGIRNNEWTGDCKTQVALSAWKCNDQVITFPTSYKSELIGTLETTVQ